MAAGKGYPSPVSCTCLHKSNCREGQQSYLVGNRGAPKPELPESRAVLSKRSAPLSRLWLMPGAGGPCGHLASCSLPGLQWAGSPSLPGRACPAHTGSQETREREWAVWERLGVHYTPCPQASHHL